MLCGPRFSQLNAARCSDVMCSDPNDVLLQPHLSRGKSCTSTTASRTCTRINSTSSHTVTLVDWRFRMLPSPVLVGMKSISVSTNTIPISHPHCAHKQNPASVTHALSYTVTHGRCCCRCCCRCWPRREACGNGGYLHGGEQHAAEIP